MIFLNPFHILTKQQAAQIRAVQAVNAMAELMNIAGSIQEMQLSGQAQEVSFNMVVRDQVADFFKSNANIKVTDLKQGQPTGFTLLQKIDWY